MTSSSRACAASRHGPGSRRCTCGGVHRARCATRSPSRAAHDPGSPMSAALDAPVCGMTWGWTGRARHVADPAAERSMDAMTELGVNWVTLAYAAVQETAQSTDIPFADAPTVTDDEIRGAVAAARARGLKVCLKPVVNVADGTWRAYIGFFDPDVPGEPIVGAVVRGVRRVRAAPRPARRRARRRDVLHRLRDGAGRRPGGALACPGRAGAGGLRRAGHLQLRQVPGGPPDLVGRGRRHLGQRLLPDRDLAAAPRPHRGRGAPRGQAVPASSRRAARAARAHRRARTTGRSRALPASGRRPSTSTRC